MNTRDGLSLAVIAAASVLSTAVAEDLYWAGGLTGYWDDADTWTNASHEAVVPGKTDKICIQASDGCTVTVANKVVVDEIDIAMLQDTTGTLIIEPGANLQSAGVQLANAARCVGTIIQNGGTYKSTKNIAFGRANSTRVGYYYLKGGSLTINDGKMLNLGYNGASGYFYQSGGTATIPNIVIPNKAGAGSYAYYEISDGTLSVPMSLTVGIATGPSSGAACNCDFKVVGSAPSIDVAGTLTMYETTGVKARLTALIDNGGVAPIRMGAASSVVLADEFVAGVAHGVAFTATNAFDVITGAPSISGSFSTLPDASLWTTEIVENGGLSTFKMALAEAGCKGTLTGGRTEMQGLAIATAAEAGYVKVNAKNVGKPMPVRLAIDPGAEKTIDDFVDFLGDAGIEVSPSDKDGYDVMFMVTPSESSSYIVWDLSSFAPDATVSAVSVGNPGPALRIMLN